MQILLKLFGQENKYEEQIKKLTKHSNYHSHFSVEKKQLNTKNGHKQNYRKNLNTNNSQNKSK